MSRKACNKQIVTAEGKTTVTMKSGRKAQLHKCNLKKGHDRYYSCGWIGNE